MSVYRLLLRLYPTSFRHEYGGELEGLFAARRRKASGLAALALWAGAVADVTVNAMAVHWELLRQDLRYAARALRRMPGFTLTAVLVVALGVGANTAAFSVADFVLLRPLPYPGAERLVKLWQTVPGYSRVELSPANYRDWKASARSFTGMAAYHGTSLNLTGRGEPERLDGIEATADLFSVLGVQPALGRLPSADEGRSGVTGTVLLSWDLWRGRFGGDPDVVGGRVLLDGLPYNVVGVMPRGFQFPRRDVRFWTTIQFAPGAFDDRSDNYLQALARLRPDASLEDARTEMAVITARLARDFAADNEHVAASVLRLRDELSQQSRLLLFTLCGAALCILLVACANLANLLLARSLARRHELALRAALGAGRERLVRQLVTESVVLAALGGTLGIVVAIAAVPLMTRLVPDTMPVGGGPALDLRALAVAGVVAALTGLAFGVLPALRASRDAQLDSLRETGRMSGRGRGLRSALVVTELAASVVLLVGSGLLLRALWRLEAVDPGFRADGVLTLRTALPTPRYDSTAKRIAFYDRVLADVRAIPGVRNAAYVSFLPMAMGGGIWPVSIDGAEARREDNEVASLRYVTPGFFSTMEIPVRQGRDVESADTRDRPAVAVVSESFARRYWPGQPVLGRQFRFALDERTIVGVVRDIMVRGVEGSSEPQVYLPAAQVNDGDIIGYIPKELIVRADGDQDALATTIGAIVRRVDPEQPVSNVRPLEAVVADQTASRAVQARLLGLLAAIAALLAGVGIHGLVSFTVSSRTRELGVRVALGAGPRDVLRLVVGQGAWLVLAGLVPGLAIAYAAGRTLGALLVSVRPGDPVTFLSVIGLCLVTAVAGSLAPAVRALRLDPVAAIRAE